MRLKTRCCTWFVSIFKCKPVTPRCPRTMIAPLCTARFILFALLPAAAIVVAACAVGPPSATPATSEPGVPSAERVDGYRGIWFTLGQFSEYGDKYSGGLGTYTAKHRPLGVYAPAVDKTFFVYGGTPDSTTRELSAMISYYDHGRGVVPRPAVVHTKTGIDDPHDNPSLSIDPAGHLWVFVSGRGRSRPGFVYRSVRPYDIDAFERIREEEFAYPQPWWQDDGMLLLFTRYTYGRELYWVRSRDGRTWSDVSKLAEGGHYQVSAAHEDVVATAFNVHVPEWNVDERSNLYFVMTNDGGRTWTTVDGARVATPTAALDPFPLVRDYRSEGRLVYLKDLAFDARGLPLILYVTSGDHRPGPAGAPRTWTIAHWTGRRWRFHEVAPALHNYDTGALSVDADGTWRLVAPTGAGPQYWGAGGEMEMWTSSGGVWRKQRALTAGSPRNHNYARRPAHAHPSFHVLWADGNPDTLSASRLYFSNASGDSVRILPYHMPNDVAVPDVFTSSSR